MEYFKFHIIKRSVQRSVAVSLDFCVRYIPWWGKEQVWNVKKYLHVFTHVKKKQHRRFTKSFGLVTVNQKKLQNWTRVDHNFKVRISTNSGKKWEIYTEKLETFT